MSAVEAAENHASRGRRSTPSRIPVLIDGQITLRDLYKAAARIDADAGADPPHMTATELVDVLFHYVKPAGWRRRGPSPRSLDAHG